MSAMPDCRVHYEGEAALVSLLISQLRGQGVDVESPDLEHVTGGLREDVVVSLVCTGSYDAVRHVIRRFIAKFGDRTRIEIEDEES